MDSSYNGKGGSCCMITPPKGFVPPENTAQGKSFDMVCTFEVAEGGKLKLTKLGDADMDMEDSDEGSSKETKPDYSEYSKGLMGGMQQVQGGEMMGG